MTKEQIAELKTQAKKVVEAKGYQFHSTSFLEGVAATERFHGLTAPTYTTRAERPLKHE